MIEAKHDPVLVTQVLDYLHIESGFKYIDATVGAGGHSAEILKRGGVVLGLDQDPKMLEVARENLRASACPNFKLVNSNFTNITQVANENGFGHVNGILFDLGISSIHYYWKERGFSFQDPKGLLDMRLSPSLGVTAADLLNTLREDHLRDMFLVSLSMSDAKRLAKKVLDFRNSQKFETVGDLLSITSFLHSKRGRNSATEVFMALRIAVNSEFESISSALPQAVDLLKQSGRLCVITFHSREDSLVKTLFRDLQNEGKVKIVTKTSVKPSYEEVLKNPRARSARLRVVEKV